MEACTARLCCRILCDVEEWAFFEALGVLDGRLMWNWRELLQASEMACIDGKGSSWEHRASMT